MDGWTVEWKIEVLRQKKCKTATLQSVLFICLLTDLFLLRGRVLVNQSKPALD